MTEKLWMTLVLAEDLRTGDGQKCDVSNVGAAIGFLPVFRSRQAALDFVGGNTASILGIQIREQTDD